MRKELPHFYVGTAFGGSQAWFSGYMMREGGCAAVTACDMSICLALYHGRKGLYPYDANHVTREEYVRFSKVMEPYLKPRWTGIDRLDIYMDGYGAFLKDRGETQVFMKPWAGENSFAATREAVRAQIDAGYALPCLTLKHRAPSLRDYVWHWFLLAGYAETADVFMVKAVTYGNWRWLDLAELWDTGYSRKGGLVLFS